VKTGNLHPNSKSSKIERYPSSVERFTAHSRAAFARFNTDPWEKLITSKNRAKAPIFLTKPSA
jgi:hypothetical protein